MIEKKIYECKYCGQTMLDPELCKQHESTHTHIDEVVEVNYIPGFTCPNGFDLKMSDGKIVRYRYVRVIN